MRKGCSQVQIESYGDIMASKLKRLKRKHEKNKRGRKKTR